MLRTPYIWTECIYSVYRWIAVFVLYDVDCGIVFTELMLLFQNTPSTNVWFGIHLVWQKLKVC